MPSRARRSELSGKGRVLVLTPHPGEMARLAGGSTADVQKNRLDVARKFAHEHDVIVVLKGNRTLVVQSDGEAWVNTTGNPGMSTGGTGDILTGMVAAMIAQNPKQPMLAVCAAVYLHGLAGDVMLPTVGEHSMIATDLLRGLPDAFRRDGERVDVRSGRISCHPDEVSCALHGALIEGRPASPRRFVSHLVNNAHRHQGVSAR